MIHSEKLEETKIWQAYQGKVPFGSERGSWVKEVYKTAVKYLLDVRQTFQNYTLHDETHILNVLDAMGGLLGDQVEKLTVGEMELLILAASLHDIGMVYTDEEKQRCFRDEDACRRFLREYCPELVGCSVEEWPKDICQWYLRTLHPFRLPEVLQNATWKELFFRCPLDVVPKRCILAVCQAHGENSMELRNNRNLEYLPANDADPLFCALLLRLGDLLDFDDTRAPKVLYSYVCCNEKSQAEWNKHCASAGFRFSASPSTDALPYKARCTNPGVEHAIRDFLDWIDDELECCFKLQRYCRDSWQREFPLPKAILRDEIESDGYMSGDFCLSMDQTQILKLLTGENLYDNRDVFVRELLQNAIDATLLRGKIDSDFIPENSRIDFWEWNDKEGNIWFRVDDQGTGMTLGMLQRYFLKVGNSYYTSKELERDLRDHGQIKKYNGISRFGIGFLSSFLCGDYAEVSTLYFDSNKNRREESVVESSRTVHYGLRLQVTGLSGYYTLKNQAKQHQIDEPLPASDICNTGEQYGLEWCGYRAKPGTSVVIRLNTGELGSLNLREATEKYLCGARVPVYYNNKRIGRTYEELMQVTHEVAGEKIYEMSSDMKEAFDHYFPAIGGIYPKIAETVVPLDTEENQVLPGLSGVLVRYNVRFEKEPQWKVKDQIYEIEVQIDRLKGESIITFISRNKDTHKRDGANKWEELKRIYGLEKISALELEFEKQPVCPRLEEQLGEVWLPFLGQVDLYEAWSFYIDSQQRKVMVFPIAEYGCPDIETLSYNNQYEDENLIFAYQGVVASNRKEEYSLNRECNVIILLEKEWIPTVEISRSRISGLALEVLVAICGIFVKYQIQENTIRWCLNRLAGKGSASLKEWRDVRASQVGKWMKENHENYFTEIKQKLQKPLDRGISDFAISSKFCTGYVIMCKYLAASIQDSCLMTIDYENGQIISFHKKRRGEIENIFDIFPPMMFCKAASSQSRQYICCAEPWERRCVTVDHPFIIWLLDNSVKLNQYYKRQFQQIVDCLCDEGALDVIRVCNYVYEQLIALPEHHGVDVDSFPRLSIDDFWSW